MSEWNVLGARKRAFHASKPISKRKRPSSQTRLPQGLGGPMVGRRAKKVEGAWAVRRHAEGRSRGADGGDSQADERQGRSQPKTGVHLWSVFNGGVPSTVPAEVERVNSNDH